jgi:TIR domain
VWLDESEIHGGPRWSEDIMRAIDGADAFLFLLTPESAASVECGKGLGHAGRTSERVLPLRVRRTRLEDAPDASRAFMFIPSAQHSAHALPTTFLTAEESQVLFDAPPQDRWEHAKGSRSP